MHTARGASHPYRWFAATVAVVILGVVVLGAKLGSAAKRDREGIQTVEDKGWYPDGSTRFVTVLNMDTHEVIRTAWLDKSGELMSISEYSEGQRGIGLRFDMEGRLISIDTTRSDLLDGPQLVFDPPVRPSYIVYYKDGVRGRRVDLDQ